jgi:hypothetical protein
MLVAEVRRHTIIRAVITGACLESHGDIDLNRIKGRGKSCPLERKVSKISFNNFLEDEATLAAALVEGCDAGSGVANRPEFFLDSLKGSLSTPMGQVRKVRMHQEGVENWGFNR